MRISFVSATMFSAFALVLTGCSTAPKTPEARQTLQDDSHQTMTMMTREDPSLQRFLDRAYGYAIFPNVGKGGAGVGGAYGRGVVYDHGAAIGYSDLSQVTVGLQLGGQDYAELIAFENEDALNKFKTGKFAFSANASAVALKAGAADAVNYDNGVAVFTKPKGGLMFEASVGGQKFTYEPMNGTTTEHTERTTTTMESR
jgi:lipid-binding SYLF domain-containing protein